MSFYDVAYYVMPIFLYVFVESVGVGAAIALYVSHRRARTEADRYILSPKYNPQLRTPKLSFIPGALLSATSFALLGVQSTFRAYLSPAIAFVGDALGWLCLAGLIGSVVILVATSRPIETRSADHINEGPTNE